MDKIAFQFISFFVQFLPLSAFASYAFADGDPDATRWMEAFALGSTLSIARLAFLRWRKKPINPLVLGTDFYLFFGLVTCLTENRLLITALSTSQATGFLIVVFITGAVAAKTSCRGFIFAESDNRGAIVNSSLILLVITGVAILISFAFRGNTLYSGVLPIASVAVAQRILRRRLK